METPFFRLELITNALCFLSDIFSYGRLRWKRTWSLMFQRDRKHRLIASHSCFSNIWETHYWNSTYAYFDLLIPEWTRSKKLLGFSWMISSRSKIKNHCLYNDSTAAKYCSVAFIWMVTLPDFTHTHTLKQERIIWQRENLRALAEICEFY